jgi:hypothetical protein
MERSSGRSPHLIARVLGDEGHLSNRQGAALLREVLSRSPNGRLRHVVQLHLSRECNRPRLARAAAEAVLPADKGVAVHTAEQNRPGERLDLGGRLRPARRTTGNRQSANGSIAQPWLPGLT